jgi:hypothetical protein
MPRFGSKLILGARYELTITGQEHLIAITASAGYEAPPTSEAAGHYYFNNQVKIVNADQLPNEYDSYACRLTVYNSGDAGTSCVYRVRAGQYNYDKGYNFPDNTGVLCAYASASSGASYVSGGFTIIPKSSLSGNLALKVTSERGAGAGNIFLGENIIEIYAYSTLLAPSASYFDIIPNPIVTGSSAILSWSLGGDAPTSIEINPGNVSVTGTYYIVSPAAETLYSLTASNTEGSTSASINAVVKYPTTIDFFTADPTSVISGSSVSLSWKLDGDTPNSATLNPGNISVDGATDYTVYPANDTVYSLTASNDYGTAYANVAVDVNFPTTITYFEAVPNFVVTGSSTILSWSLGGDAQNINTPKDLLVLSGSKSFANPIAAEKISIYPATRPATGSIVLAGQPDVPRKLQVEVISAAATNAIGTGSILFVEGVGASGEDVADIFDLNIGAAVTVAYTSSYAYASVYRASITNLTFNGGDGSGSTVSIGVSNHLGLDIKKHSVTKDTKPISQKLIIPAYFRPGSATPDGYWDQMVTCPVGSIIIFNPYNGPGSGSDEVAYRTKLKACHDAGMKCVGYLSSDYAARNIDGVISDIDNYYSLYQISGTDYIDGFFVDEVYSIPSSESSPASWSMSYNYYKSIYDYVHTTLGKTNATVVMNPGASVNHSVMQVADVVVGLENERTVYDSWGYPTWQFHVPASKNAVLIKKVSYANLPARVWKTKAQNFGYIYLTLDGYDGNPWDTIPTDSPDPYWSTLKAMASSSQVEIRPTMSPIFSAYEDRGYIDIEWQYTFLTKTSYSSKYRDIIFDTDLNSATGKLIETEFLPATSFGANYLIECYYAGASDTTTTGILYSWNGSSWASVKAVTISPASQGFSHGIRCRISRADLGNVTGSIRVMGELKDGAYRCTSIQTVQASDLPVAPLSQPFNIYSGSLNETTPITGTVDQYAGTILPATAPDGTNDYNFWYTYAYEPPYNSVEINPGQVYATGTYHIVSPADDTTYSLTASNDYGTAYASATVDVKYPTTITYFEAVPSVIVTGSSAILSWTLGGDVPNSATLNPGAISVTGTYYIVSPSSDTTYSLTASNDYGNSTATSSLTVLNQASITYFEVIPDTVIYGSQAIISWSVNGAEPITKTINPGAISVTGSYHILAPNVGTYYFTASNAYGTSTTSSNVNIQYPATITYFEVIPDNVISGSSAILSWTLGGDVPSSATLNPGNISVTGTYYIVSPASSTLYSLTASNEYGNSRTSSSLTVYQPTYIGYIEIIPAWSYSGSPAVISWSLGGDVPNSATLNPGNISVTGTYYIVSASTDTVFSLTASNDYGHEASSVVYDVKYPTIITNFSATPSTLPSGSSAILSWSLSGDVPNSATLNPGAISVTGTYYIVSPADDTTYSLTASNDYGFATSSVYIDVGHPATIISMTVSKYIAQIGDKILLSWSLGGDTATSIILNPGNISVTGNYYIDMPNKFTTYELTASNAYGSAYSARSVVVQIPPKSSNFTYDKRY